MVHIYYNPFAGAGNAAKLLKRVQDFLTHEDKRFVLLPQDLASVSEDTPITVIGGDGTFNALLNALPNPEKYRFILLSGGTSNSLYSQISPKEDPIVKLRRYFSAPKFRKIDLAEISVDGKSYRFVNEASAGFAAAIARSIEQRNTKHFFNRMKLNELAYIATAFRCWVNEEPYFLSFCNNRRISGDLIPCVNADLSDGKIDCYELSCPRLRLPFELTRLVKAKQDKPSPFVTRTQVANAEWHFEKPLPVEIDGNPLPAAQDIRISLYPEKIRVF